ncbi:hypothetical protein MP228_001824 [Amoeboaphelidium protococcarum]|nr:hypothetical protein MP228_001824 [Amoeboaphelidium protococcarum]
MLNISYDLCGAQTVCWYVGPSLVSFFPFNHSLVQSRRLKQSRWAALLHLALSTAYSTAQVTAVLLRYLYAAWCLLVLHIKSLNAAEPLVSSRSSSCYNSILFLIKHACSSMLCSMSTILTLLKLLHGSLKESEGSAPLKKNRITQAHPGCESSLFRQLLLQLCPSLLLSRTQLHGPLRLGAKSLQLTGADGSTHSATGLAFYDVQYTFDYLWYYVGVACGNHTYSLDSITVSVSCLCTVCFVLNYSYSTALLLAVLHTWTLPDFWLYCTPGSLVSSLSLSLCLCSKYVPTEVRPVTIGPLKGALCLTTLIPRHCFWLYCTLGLCPDFWLYCTPGSSVTSLSSPTLM